MFWLILYLTFGAGYTTHKTIMFSVRYEDISEDLKKFSNKFFFEMGIFIAAVLTWSLWPFDIARNTIRQIKERK